jgi:hypothetical protein
MNHEDTRVPLAKSATPVPASLREDGVRSVQAKNSLGFFKTW